MSHFGDIMWAAGLFEGEGSFFVDQARGQPGATLGSVDFDILERFAAIVGVGNIRPTTAGTNSPMRYWTTRCRKDVKYVIELLLPHLGQRRQEKALEVLIRCEYADPTRCRSGRHLWTPATTYIAPKTGTRMCRACATQRARDTRERQRQEKQA